MSETRTAYQTVTPYLVVADAEAEIEFMAQAFGGHGQSCERRPDGTVMHAEIRIGDSMIMLGQSSPEVPPRQAALFLWLDDVDAAYAKALAAGARTLRPPEDQSYGHRSAGVEDPCGTTWWLGAPVKTGSRS